MTVEQAMRTDVLFARLDEPMGTVAARLETAVTRALPVVDDVGRLQGIVGRRDVERAGADQALTLLVTQRDLVTLFPDQSLDLALLKLGRHSVRQAPVVSRDAPDHVVGMLSLEDISAAIGRSHLPSA
jgi:CIC family chloride channel protein